MIYKHVEHWDLHDQVLEEIDAPPAELASESEDDALP